MYIWPTLLQTHVLPRLGIRPVRFGNPAGVQAPEAKCQTSFIVRGILPGPRRYQQHCLLFASGGALAVLVGAWLVVILAVNGARFVLLAEPTVQVGVEAAAALARVFSALVLFLFPGSRTGRRLQWVATGLVAQALGGLLFGYLAPMADSRFDPNDLNASTYASLLVSSVAGALFVVGLVLRAPPPLTGWAGLPAIVALGLLGIGLVVGAEQLPPLVQIPSIATALTSESTVLPGLTSWYWTLVVIPVSLALVATVGAVWQWQRAALGGWLVVAMVLFAGAQLHQAFWPSTYTPILTTATLLRLAFALVVAVGGLLALRQVATERATLLRAEQEYSRRLTELAVLKADFTAMVAHELSGPVAAIRGLADMLAGTELDRDYQALALAAIRTETQVLDTLVADAHAAATVEHNDFNVNMRPVPVNELLAHARVFARTLPGDHSLVVTAPVADVQVWADPERIGQVARNLLSNAAKYSPAGTPIELRITRQGSGIRFEVADQGMGIHPDDLVRIFEKFGRGRDAQGQRVPGVGLGLYLSRRIVQAHGAEISVVSAPGEGSVFAFELEAVR
jgi:signal transduction histidine kinase